MRAGTLIVDIAANVARLEKDMAQAKGIVAGAARDIERSIGGIKTALGAFGVGYLATELVRYGAELNKATSALDDMAEVTGAAVEELSKFQHVAKIGGHELSLVEDSLVKLVKGLKGVDEETAGAAHALQFLGIQAKDATGKLRDPGAIMSEVAGKLIQFEDGAGKTAIALDLFGKSGAKLLPFLKDMAQEGEIAARVTGEQASRAEELEKNLNRLKTAAWETHRSLLGDLTPALVKVSEAMVRARRDGDGFFGALIEGWRTFITGDDLHKANVEITDLTSRQWDLQETIAGKRKMAAARPSMGPAVDLEIRPLLRELAEVEARLKVVTGYRDILVAPAASPDKKKDANDYASGKPKPPGARADGSSLLASLQDQLDRLNGESSVFDSTMRKLTEGTKQYSAETRAAALALASEIDELRKVAAEREAAMKSALASVEAFEAKQEQLGEQKRSMVRAFAQERDALQLEIDLMGLSNAEREKAIAFRKIEAEASRASVLQTEAEIKRIWARAEAQKAEIGALIDTRAARSAAQNAADEARKAYEDGFKSRSESLTRTISDGLMRGFEKGAKSGAEVVVDTLRNALRTAVFEPVIHAAISPISRAITGATMGMFGGGSGGGFSLGGFNPLSAFTNQNFGSMIGSPSLFGYSGLAGGTAALGGTSAAAGFDIALGGLGGTAGAEALVAGAPGISAALPWIGGALAIGGALGMFGDDDNEPPPGFRHPLWAVLKGKPGAWGVGSSELADLDKGLPMFAAVNAAINDPRKYDQATLARLGDGATFTAAPGSGSDVLLNGLLGQAASVAQMREQLRMATDPRGYWMGQVSTLGGELGTGARTVGDWQKGFLAALDSALTAEDLKKWQDLGAAIQQASSAAGVAARQISPNSYATRVDYRRALLAGGAGAVDPAGTNPAVQAEIAAMRRELKAGLEAIALHTSRTARVLDRNDGPNGLLVASQ